jgi:hypothetical protein
MLRLLIEDAGLRDIAVQKARERIQNYYLWPQIARQIEDVYLNVMGRPRAGRKPSASTAEPDVETRSQIA